MGWNQDVLNSPGDIFILNDNESKEINVHNFYKQNLSLTEEHTTDNFSKIIGCETNTSYFPIHGKDGVNYSWNIYKIPNDSEEYILEKLIIPENNLEKAGIVHNYISRKDGTKKGSIFENFLGINIGKKGDLCFNAVFLESAVMGYLEIAGKVKILGMEEEQNIPICFPVPPSA